MKGVILAGGSGTRLRPLTRVVNKHLLPVGKYPMIHYALQHMAEAGIQDIMVITGKPSAGLYTEYIGSGEAWGVKVCFKIQEQPGGIAQGLGLAEGFVAQGDKTMLLLGDNLFEDSLSQEIREFEEHGEGARVFLKQVDDPSRYGVPVLNENKIERIMEKPEQPPSDYAVTGIYLYDSDVFQHIRSLTPSARGELEITDLNNKYADAGKLSFGLLHGWWTDAGTHESLLEAGQRLLERERR